MHAPTLPCAPSPPFLRRVRMLVRKRLGDPSVLARSSFVSNVRKRRGARAGAKPSASATTTPCTGLSRAGSAAAEDSGAESDGGATAPGERAASSVVLSATASAVFTVGTATTFRTKASQPDHMRVPGEYEKVGVAAAAVGARMGDAWGGVEVARVKSVKEGEEGEEEGTVGRQGGGQG
eukprot:365239-Chlamydomonas_euryale.AAC.8